MKLYNLKSSAACKKLKAFQFKPQAAVSDFVIKSRLMTESCKNQVFGQSREDALAVLKAGFETLTYPTEATREYDYNHSVKLIDRYVSGELAITCRRHNPTPGFVDIGVSEDVFVDPEFVRIGMPYFDNITGTAYDGTIYVTKIHIGKAPSAKKASEDLAKYAMLKYGRTLVSNGKTVLIVAEDIYLVRADDAGENAKAPNFNLDFWANGGNNVTVVSETYVGGTKWNETDDKFKPFVDAYNEGHEPEECSESDCEACVLHDICHYTEPPIRIQTSMVNRTIQDLTLTDAQDEAIDYEKGIVRINAGAGVGKTVVVALRTVTLLNKGVKPEEIVLMTFTNSGAEEMRTRIQLYNDDIGTGEDISAMKICTFNSFGDDILKVEYPRFGFTEPPKVIDEVERARIISNILKKHMIVGLNYNNFIANTQYVKGAVPMTQRVFDIVKKGPYTVLDVDAVYNELGRDVRFFTRPGHQRETLRDLIQLYDEYDQELRDNNLIEFADQEMMLFELLQKDPYYLEKFGFKHIIVDEFQDSNAKQIELLKVLISAPSFESLMVVGDDSQAIFGFRNTSPEFIIDFSKYIGEEADDIFLLENHRCTPEIIDFANKMNSKNIYRVAKDLVATRPSGVPVIVKGFHTTEDEQKYIIDGVKEHLADGWKPEDIAIICSTKSELRKFASLLTKEGIESVSLNPEPFLENSRVKAAICFTLALNNESDTQDLMVYANAKSGGVILEKNETEIAEMIKDAAEDVKKVNEAESDAKKDTLLEILKAIDHNDDEIYQRFLDTLNVKRFEQIVEYCGDFLVFGEKNEAKREHNYPGVVLTTCHSSKGLEWPVVYASLSKFDDEKNALHTNQKDMEERRRLLFVTATRARDELFITSKYIAYGKKGEYVYNPFLADSYDCVGMKFDIKAIEAEAAKIAEEKKKQRAEERKALAEKMKKTTEKLV